MASREWLSIKMLRIYFTTNSQQLGIMEFRLKSIRQ